MKFRNGNADGGTGRSPWRVTVVILLGSPVSWIHAAGPLVPGFPDPPKRATPEFQEAFMRAEADAPDSARMLMGLSRNDMMHAVTACLPRHFSPDLGPATRVLLDHKDPVVRAAAISGMISQWDDAPASRERITRGLASASAVVRSRTAEYFCWMGLPGDYQALTKAAAGEKDRHALAAMTEAAAAIKRRHKVFAAGAAATPQDAGEPLAIYQSLAELLEEHPTDGTRRAVIARLKTVEKFEPVTRYAARLDHGDRGDALIRLHRLLAGYGADCDTPGVDDSLLEAPPASPSLIPPVRDYFDAARKSWGFQIEDAAEVPFAGKRHVGDDAAWLRDQETVVAIGPGIVRRAEVGVRSWGGIVIVEHSDRQGKRFCSLYAHLGPMVCVKPGQLVAQGQKLGAVGISLTHANGGYMSHIHFGIHRSAWMQPDKVGEKIVIPGDHGEDSAVTITAVDDLTAEGRRDDGSTVRIPRRADWPCGYLKPAEFESPANRWVDPQRFIREYK